MAPEFNNLLDIDCTCLLAEIKNYPENTDVTFCRKLDGNTLRIQDFRSRWEKGKRDVDGQEVFADDCEGILSLKGISVDLYNDKNKENILRKYKTTFTFNKRKVKYAIFQFQIGAGRVRHSPRDGDLSHHDFYKCDAFSIEHIIPIGIGDVFGGTQ